MQTMRLSRKAKVGERVRLSLQTPASGGYAWQVSSLVLSTFRLVRPPPEPGGGFGGALTEHFDLEPLRPGRFQLRFELKRPWECEPVELVDLAIEVRAA